MQRLNTPVHNLGEGLLAFTDISREFAEVGVRASLLTEELVSRIAGLRQDARTRSRAKHPDDGVHDVQA